MQKRNLLIGGFWAFTLALFVVALVRVVKFTPDESTMGPIQKIFYLHLPVAINTFLACLVAFIASIGYLSQRKTWWDDLASASARVAVQLCTIVLITGMLWGKSAWGQWWTWSPRLTFSLVLWLLYTVYLIIRSSIESAERRALISAVYAIIAFLDVPLVYLSVRLMPDIHPAGIELASEMKLTLVLWFAAVTVFSAGVIAAKYGLNRMERDLLNESRQDGHVPAVGGFAC
ncbi:cytochrome c biogenesis protein CcsA [soil metagenome]